MMDQARAAESVPEGASRAAGDHRPFIADLRARLQRGDFREIRNLSLGNEFTLTDLELAVRDLIREVDQYADMPPTQREQYPWKGRQDKLADRLRRLQRVLVRP